MKVVSRFKGEGGERRMEKFLGRLHRCFFNLLILLLPVQLGKHFWPDWAMVGGIRIDYLAPTIYLTDLLVIGVLVSWGMSAALNIKNQKLNIKITNQNVKRIILLFSFFILNVLFAQNKPVVFLKLLKITELVLLAVYIKNNLSIRQFDNWTILLSVTVIYSSIIAWAQFLRQSSIGGLLWWLGERSFTSATPGIARVVLNGRLFLRPYATFPHPNVLAGHIATVLPLLILNQKPKTKNQKHKLKIKNILRILAVVLGIITLFITFSRAAWVIGGIGTLISFMLVSSRLKKGKKSFGRLLSCYLVILLIALLLLGKERLLQLKAESESIITRQELNAAALLMIKKYPLTGVGLNNFIPSLSKFKKGLSYQELQPAHNIYLLIGAETGLVGLGLFGWLIYLSYKKLLSCYLVILLKKKAQTKIISWQHSKIAIALTGILLLSLFDHYFFTLQQTQLLFAIVMGMVFGVRLE